MMDLIISRCKIWPETNYPKANNSKCVTDSRKNSDVDQICGRNDLNECSVVVMWPAGLQWHHSSISDSANNIGQFNFPCMIILPILPSPPDSLLGLSRNVSKLWGMKIA